MGPFSITEHCFLKKDVSNYVFDFAIDFHKKYKGKAKYSFNYQIDAHEPSTFVPRYSDEKFVEFL